MHKGIVHVNCTCKMSVTHVHVHCTWYIVHCTWYIVNYTCIIHMCLVHVHCAIQIVHVHCTCALYMYTVQFKLYMCIVCCLTSFQLFARVRLPERKPRHELWRRLRRVRFRTVSKRGDLCEFRSRVFVCLFDGFRRWHVWKRSQRMFDSKRRRKWSMWKLRGLRWRIQQF